MACTRTPRNDPWEIFVLTASHFQQTADKDQKEMTGFCIEATKYLYREMFSIGDFSGALKAIQELAKLSKLLKVDAESPSQSKAPDRKKLLKMVQNAG